MRRLLVIVLIFAAAFAVNRYQHNSVKAKFMRKVHSRIAKNHPGIRIKGQKDFGLNVTINGSEAWLGLGNMYDAYKADPRDFSNIVDTYVGAAKEGMGDQEMGWRLVEKRILPALKPEDFGLTGMTGNDLGKDRLVTYPFRKGIKTIIAIDSQHSIRFVSESDLKTWKISSDDLMKTALQNLALLTSKRWNKADATAKKQGFFAFEVGDCYDASRLLLPDFREHACRSLGCTRIAVSIPTRDLLIAVAADDPEQVDQLKELTEEAYKEGPYSISREIMYLPE